MIPGRSSVEELRQPEIFHEKKRYPYRSTRQFFFLAIIADGRIKEVGGVTVVGVPTVAEENVVERAVGVVRGEKGADPQPGALPGRHAR